MTTKKAKSDNVFTPAKESSKMNPTWKKRWMKALRSGEFKQTTECLHITKAQSKRGIHVKNEGYCCLGVLCAINPKVEYTVAPGDIGTTYYYKGTAGGGRHATGLRGEMPPIALRKEMGLSKRQEDKLARMNDDGKSFKEIADYIEKNM